MNTQEILSTFLNTPEGKVVMAEFAKIAIKVANEKPKENKWLSTEEALKRLGQTDIRVLHNLYNKGEIKKRGSRKTLQWNFSDYE